MQYDIILGEIIRIKARMTCHGKRRKTITLILVLAMSIMDLAAYDLEILIGNDNVTYGLANNNDDGLSFGSKVSLSLGSHDLSLELKGITNRGYTIDDILYQGRYDEMIFSYGYDFILESERNSLILSPQFRLSLIGDLGFDWIQNTYHDLIEKKEVNLPYDYDSFYLVPGIGFMMEFDHHFGNNNLFVLNDLNYTPGFSVINSTFIGFNLDNFIRLSLGYRYIGSLEGEINTHYIQGTRDSGLLMKTNLDGRLFAMEYTINLFSDVSYGLIGINPLAFLGKNSYEDNSLFINVGAEFGYPGYMHRLSLGYKNYLFGIKYVGGELEVGSNKRMTNAVFYFSYDFIWEKKTASPFIRPYLGINKYSYYRQNQTNNLTELLIYGLTPTVGLELGLRFLDKSQFIVDSDCYRFNLGLSLSYNFLAKSISSPSYPEFDQKLGPISARIFFELNINS